MEKRDDVIILRDEDGNEVSFEYLDTVSHEKEEYVVLLPMEEDQGEEGQVVILKLHEEDGQEAFHPLSKEGELDAVFEVFKEKMKDAFDFVD